MIELSRKQNKIEKKNKFIEKTVRLFINNTEETFAREFTEINSRKNGKFFYSILALSWDVIKANSRNSIIGSCSVFFLICIKTKEIYLLGLFLR